MVNRRQAFHAAASRRRGDPSHHPPHGGDTAATGGGGGGGTLLFIFFPLALLFYVWNTVQDEPNMVDPRDATLKGGGELQLLWEIENDTEHFLDNQDQSLWTPAVWSMMEDEEALLLEDMDDKIPITGLWILVESWHPGMPHWKQALAEIFVLAKSLQAVLVEPGIHQAELVPCHHQESIPLSHVYNRTRMIQFYSPLASCTKYEFAMNQLTAPRIFDICFHPNSDECEAESYYQERINDVLEDAMEYAHTHPHNMVLLRLHHVWKSSMDELTLPLRPNNNNNKQQQQSQPSKRTPPIIDPAMVTRFETHHLEFALRHYQFLHSQLQAKGISYASYAVIHWNPPPAHRRLPSTTTGTTTTGTTTTSTMDSTDCVDAILQVQRAMNLPITTPFFLITTIPLVDDVDDNDEDALDRTTEEQGTIQNQVHQDDALALLYKEHHFLQLETILSSWQQDHGDDMAADSIMGIVLNLILAQQAFSFTTCAASSTTSTTTTMQPKRQKKQKQPNSCHVQFPFCETCHVGGIFAEWALALRHHDDDDENNPNTFPCWPKTSSELPAIHNLWNSKR